MPLSTERFNEQELGEGIVLIQEVIAAMQDLPGVSVGIDRVVLAPAAVTQNARYAMMCSVREYLPFAEPQPKVKSFKKDGCDALVGRFFNEQGKRILTVTAGLQSGNPYVHIALNPAKTTYDDRTLIEVILVHLFEENLERLFETARLVTIELFADLVNVDIAEVIPIASRKIPRTNYVGKTSTTIYLGGRNNRLSVAVYDKRQQLLDQCKIATEHALTRVEIRLSPDKKTLLHLATDTLKNPWEQQLFVIPLASFSDFCKFYKYPKLEEDIISSGNVASFNKEAKKDMLKKLPAHCLPQWKPKLFWKMQINMARFFFSHLGGLPYQF